MLCTPLLHLTHQPRYDIRHPKTRNLWATKSWHMGVSKNNGTPKWMVKIMENPIEIDDLVVPFFLETPKSWHLFGPKDQGQATGPKKKSPTLRAPADDEADVPAQWTEAQCGHQTYLGSFGCWSA